MDKDIELNFKQVKDVIKDIKNTLNDIKETEEYSSTGNNTGTIILSGTKKYETIELPNGILYNIKSKETTTFKKDSMFKYINDNPKSTLIPNRSIVRFNNQKYENN